MSNTTKPEIPVGHQLVLDLSLLPPMALHKIHEGLHRWANREIAELEQSMTASLQANPDAETTEVFQRMLRWQMAYRDLLRDLQAADKISKEYAANKRQVL